MIEDITPGELAIDAVLILTALDEVGHTASGELTIFAEGSAAGGVAGSGDGGSTLDHGLASTGALASLLATRWPSCPSCFELC